MKESIDYKTFYRKWYKKLPIIAFYFVLVSSLMFTLFLFGTLIGKFPGFAMLLLSLGTVISIGVAVLTKWLVSIKISQSVVVADTLLEINRKLSGDPVDIKENQNENESSYKTADDNNNDELNISTFYYD